MKKIDEDELLDIIGGFSITGTIINAFTSAAKFVFQVGVSLGSAIRRLSGNNLCKC